VNAQQTHVYKMASGCEIRADVHPPAGAPGRPGIVWIHGGALIMGSRRLLARWQRDLYLQAGFAVIAIDYRLAPETKLPAIIDDLQDAFAWARREGPHLFGLDPLRLAAVGHSAGGYLTLMAGCCVDPRPRALVSFYGYGDIIGPWYSQPDPFYCREPAVSAEEARASVGSTPIAESSGDQDERRDHFYLYCRQRGLWPKEVSGHDPHAEAGWFSPYCPVQNVTPEYPPTLLLHGERDTDVPYEQSEMMAEALEQAGVEHEFVAVPDGDHGFDAREDAAATAAMDRVLRFLQRHAE
jgi:acetyl esterase/lipase